MPRRAASRASKVKMPREAIAAFMRCRTEASLSPASRVIPYSGSSRSSAWSDAYPGFRLL